MTTATYPLSPALLQQIQSILDARQGLSSAQTNYVDAYNLIFNAIKDDPAVDNGTKNWLSVAISVNSDNPKDLVFQYVRAETQIAVSANDGPNIGFTEFHDTTCSVAELYRREAVRLPHSRG